MVDRRMGFGRGKAILLREHSVVRGSPAISVGIGRGGSAVARLADEDLLTVSRWSSRVRPDKSGEDPLERAFAIALDAYSNRPGLSIDAQVDLPAGAGLGCSAASGAAVFDAIDRALCISRSREELGTMVHEWEEVFQGSASGLDDMTAAVGGVLRYQQETPLKRLSLAQPLHLVIVHSGETSRTKDMVSPVACQLASNPARVRAKFDTMSDLVDDLCRLTMAQGALGAKVTGAGGGGCIVALAEDEEHAHRIRDVLGSRSFVEEVRQ